MLFLYLRSTSGTWLCVNTLISTPSMTIVKLTQACCYKRLTFMESNLLPYDTAHGHPDLSFQHHGVRKCLTLSMVLLIWGKSPLSWQSPVSLCGHVQTRTFLTGASYAKTVIRARSANILALTCKTLKSPTALLNMSMWTL